MAKFYGAIGYGVSKEDPIDSGIWVDEIIEHNYYGDITRRSRRTRESDNLNDDIIVDNEISIVADRYATEHFFNIKYIVWEGVRWTVSNVVVQPPRLILYLGKVYNGPTPRTP